MEIVAGVGAIAGSIAPAVGTGLSALGGSAGTALSFLQGGTSILSALSSIGGGIGAERAAKTQAKLSSTAEYIGGQASALALRRQLADDMSGLAVGYAASGVTSQGTPQNIAKQWQRDTKEAIQLETGAARIRQISAFMGGQTGAATAGAIEGAGTIGNFLIDFLKRGGPVVA